MPFDESILGSGVYTPREAARLVGTSPQQVLRWTRGSGPNAPLWNAHYQFLDADVTDISFLDLVEVRVVAAMRRAGVSLQAIRFAMSFAQERLGVVRPLASQSFRTDGSEILMEAVERDGQLMSLSSKRPGQKVFREIILQSLNDLEYDQGMAIRWRPRQFSDVVIDPARSFGDPILDDFGISTAMLRAESRDGSSSRYLSRLYEIPERMVRTAIAFEEGLDRRNG